MPALRPLRFVGPVLLAVSLTVAVYVKPLDSPLALLQVGLVCAGSLLVTIAAVRNPLRATLGWRPILGFGEVALGVAVPLGVLGTGVRAPVAEFFGLVAAIAGVGLLLVVGLQVLPDKM